MIASLPAWAQPHIRQFAAGQTVEGTSNRPAQPAEVDAYIQSATSMLVVAGQDEREGADQAMGQPGVVVNSGMTFTFNSTPERFELVASGSQGTEMALYTEMGPHHFSMVGLQRQGDHVVVNGGRFQRSDQDSPFQGFLLSDQG